MTTSGERRPIVLGVDSLNISPMVVDWAAAEATRRNLPLRLVHAVLPEAYELRGFDGGRFHEALRHSGETALEKAMALVHERHPAVETTSLLAEDNPAKVLCRESERAQLLVLGSRRMNRLEEWLSGYSVTVPVSAQAHCPVVVIRAPEHVTQQPPYVVVGVDGSRSAAAAVEFAADFATRRRAALRAVSVWQVPLIVPAEEHAVAEMIREQLHQATAGLTDHDPDLDLTHEVLTGHPVEQLAQASAHALAVVVGRRGRGGFTGMRLGPVPHGLLHHAHCPVITVPAHH
ncbi:universal stress protein [Kitasatospora sp. NPDC002227]|uniref:universal stress protein n=1 Tax=Kitasatospora sp. NPDC002227 TaxID=3154773 RepID=UPI0033302A30